MIRYLLQTLAEVGAAVRPPIPPKGPETPLLTPPQPPPRKNKKAGSLPSFGRGSQVSNYRERRYKNNISNYITITTSL